MSDIATLGLEMPSEGLKEGLATLRALPNVASAAERAVEKLGMTNAAAGQSSEEFSRRVRRNIEALEFQSAQMVRSAAEQERYTALRRAGVAADTAAGQAITASIAKLQAQREAQRQMNDAARAAAQQQADSARASQQAASAVSKLIAELEFERAQLSRTSTERLQYDAIRRAGVTAASAEGKAIMSTVAALESERTVLRQVEAARLAAGKATTTLTAQQKLVLGYQLNDIFTSVVGGMNPAMIAAQQGPQITQIFGGLRNTIAAIPKPALVAGGGLLAGLGIGFAVNELKDLSDAADEQKRRLTSLLGSQQLAAAAYGEITKQAIATGTAIADVTSRFSTFASSTKALGATPAQIMDLVAGSGQLGKIGGSTPEETAAGVTAIAKALSASVVSGEALQAIFDAMPAAASAIADGIGVSTSQLKLMAQQGNLTNQNVFTSLLGQTDKLKKDFDELPGTIGTVFAGLIIQAEDFSAKLYKGVVNFKIMTDRSKELGVGQGGGGPAYVDSRPNINYGTPVYVRQFNQSDAAALEMGLAGGASASVGIGKAITDAADAAVLAGAKIASAIDPAAASAKNLQEQFAAINAGVKALAASSFDSATKADQLDKMSAAAERLKKQIQDAGDAVTQASRELGLLAIDRVNDNTPAGMAIAARSRQLLNTTGNTSTPAQATDVARGELDAQAATAIRAALDTAAAQDKLTAATGRGKAAMIDAQVEVAKMSFQLQYFGQNPTEEAIRAINAFGDATRKNLTALNTAATIDASKPMIDDLYAVAAAMDVVAKGAYAMRRAEVEARAARDENGTGQLQLDVFDSRQELTDATTLHNLQQQIELTNALAAAAGDVARQKQIQLDYDIKIAQQNAGPGAQVEIEQKMRQDFTAKQSRDLAEGVASMEKQLELTREQTAIVRSGSADYAVQIAMLQKKRELIAQGADIEKDANAQRQIVLAGEQARADIQKQHATDAADATKRIWMTANDNIQSYAADSFYNIFSGAKFDGADAAQSLKNIFLRTFAEIAAAAVIRPLITPLFQAGAMAGIVPSGAVPAATGSTGGIGGMLGGIGNIGSIGSMATKYGSQAWNWLGGLFGGGGAAAASGAASAGGYSSISALLSSGTTGASAAATGAAGAGGLLSAIPVWGWMAAAASIVKSFTGNAPKNQPLGMVDTLLGPSIEQWQSNPGRSAFTMLNPLGPIGMVLSDALGLGLFSDDSNKRQSASTNSSLRYGSNGFFTYGGAYGSNVSSTPYEQQLGSAGTGMTSILDKLGGVKDASKMWGMDLDSWTQSGKDWSYTSQSTQLVDPNGNRTAWRMNEGNMVDTASAQVTMRSILDGAVGEITQSMRTAVTSMLAATTTLQDVAKGVAFVTDTYDQLGKTVSSIKPDFEALDQKFKEMSDTATTLGLSLAPIDAEQKKQTDRLGQDYIDNLIDPAAAALRAFADEKDSILANIDYIKEHTDVVVDAARVNEALLRKEADLKEQLTNGAISQLDDAIKRLTYGDLANVSGSTTISGMQASFDATVAQARGGDMTAYGRVAGEGTALAQAYQNQFASGPQYETFREQLLNTFRELQIQAGGGMSSAPMPANDFAQTNQAMAAMLSQLQAVNDNQARQISELLRKQAETNDLMQRLLSRAA